MAIATAIPMAKSDYFQNPNTADNKDKQKYWQKILSIIKKQHDRDKTGYTISTGRLHYFAFEDKYNLTSELQEMEQAGLIKFDSNYVIAIVKERKSA